MAETEVQPGFDRRSLIKKGLVGAGIAATAPVISTFNTAAFAQSLDGFWFAQYDPVSVNASGQITSVVIPRVAKTTVGSCDSAIDVNINDTPEIPAADITAAPSGGAPPTTVTWTLTGDCVFDHAAADFGNGAPQCLGQNVNFTGIGTNTLVFDPPSVARDYRIRIVINCG